MVLGHGFESRLHLKTRWKDGSLDGRKSNEKIKAAKCGQATPKKTLKNLVGYPKTTPFVPIFRFKK
jgi:hypothetical protein